MIVVDPLFDTTPFTRPSTPRCFKNTLASHMMTTLEGEAGRLELIAFAKRLGLKPEWIQYPGTRRQHFDLVQAKRARAVKLGAIEVPASWMQGDPLPGSGERSRSVRPNSEASDDPPPTWKCPKCGHETDEPAFTLSHDQGVYCPECPGLVGLEVNPAWDQWAGRAAAARKGAAP